MAKLFANSRELDQTPRSAASDMGQLITLFGVIQIKIG